MNNEQKELLDKVFDNYANELEANLYERATRQEHFDDAWHEFHELKKKTYDVFNKEG